MFKEQKMTSKSFYPGLIIITIVCICISYWCTLHNTSSHFIALLFICLFFLIFTAGLYYIANKTVYSKNLYQFTRVFLVSVFVKMFLFIGAVAFMIKSVMLEPKPLVLPLISIYVLFTVYETYYLMRLSKA